MCAHAVQVWYKECFCSGGWNVHPIEKSFAQQEKKLEGTLTGTPASLEEKNALPNCGKKKRWKHNSCTYIFYFHLRCNRFEVWNDCTHMYKSLVFGDAFLTQCLHLKSHQRCSAGIRTCLSANQSSSSTLTESSFLFDPCLIHRGTVMLE